MLSLIILCALLELLLEVWVFVSMEVVLQLQRVKASFLLFSLLQLRGVRELSVVRFRVIEGQEFIACLRAWGLRVLII